jgi:hypothetical protein
MTLRSKALPLLLLLSLLTLGAGCLFDTPVEPPPPPQPREYVPYYDPDPTTAMNNLVENFITAWEKLDLAQYRDSILYNAIELATDGLQYAPFTFYYDQSLDPDLPILELYDREIQRATRMFGGLPGQDADGTIIPGIKSIDLDLTANNSWSNPLNPDDVDGDPYPVGTKMRSYNTQMLITLKSNIPGTEFNGWKVEDLLIFHVIPVRIENLNAPGTYHTVYRIWKWRDVID